MGKTLYIKCSPLMFDPSKGSVSTKMGDLFLKHYTHKNPTETIIELDLNKERVGTQVLTAQGFVEFFGSTETKTAIEQLKGVDKVILPTPMINFNYPAVLKNYIDHIMVANQTFRYKYDRNGESEGLLTHLKVQLLTTQGADYGWYLWGNHTENLRGAFEFVGAKVVAPITIFGTKTPSKIKQSAEEIIAPFAETIRAAAERF